MDLRSRRHALKSNATAFAEMIRLLNIKAYTKAELTKLVGIQIYTVTKWLKILEHKELVYVEKYHRDGTVGQWAAKWAFGYKVASATRPKAQSSAQYSRNYRILQTVKRNIAKKATS